METWAIVCGAVRDELELRLTMDELLNMRKRKEIQGIILSTWENEFNTLPELKKELLNNEIDIIELTPLEKRVSLERTTSINYFRQSLQMQAALDRLPEKCIVLKARTDRSIQHIKLVQPYLSNFLENNRIEDELIFQKEMPKIFEYQMVILNAKTHRIFNFSDFVFIGYANDIRKMMNFDVAELYLGRDLVANTQWFIYPFFKEFPVIRDYFRLINFRPLISEMKEHIDQEANPEPLPKFFYRVYGSYLIILKHYFKIVDMLFKEPLTPMHFTDLFIDNKEKGLAYTPLGTVLLSETVVDYFLNPQICQGTEMDSFYFQQLSQPDLFSKISEEEYQELSDFSRNNSWFTGKNWLRSRASSSISSQQSQDYNTSVLNYHFAELSEQENNELLETLKNKDRIDRFLYNFWLNRESLGADSAMQMVFPLARTRAQEPILIMSRLLRLGRVASDTDKKNIEYLIKVTFDVQTQRGAVNIKTCQLMINLIMLKGVNQELSFFYKEAYLKKILDRYLEKSEYEYVYSKQMSIANLADYLLDLSAAYAVKGRETRSVRLLELATEIDLTEGDLQLLFVKYTNIGDKRNAVLSKKTIPFFYR